MARAKAGPEAGFGGAFWLPNAYMTLRPKRGLGEADHGLDFEPMSAVGKFRLDIIERADKTISGGAIVSDSPARLRRICFT